MIYEKRLRRERTELVEYRTISIHQNIGYDISSEDKLVQGSLLTDRAVGFRSAQWRATEQGAFGLADTMLKSSIDDGFVLVDVGS